MTTQALSTATLTTTFRSMASTVTVQVADPCGESVAALREVQSIFARVEAACTRFDPHSPLMRANAAGDGWCPVPPECSLALAEAARAYRVTGGLFDPRVLNTLVALGYDRSLPFARFEGGRLRLDVTAHQTAATPELPGDVPLAEPRPSATGTSPGPWEPEIDHLAGRVRIGPHPVDLGGIGKGLAVRWAAPVLAATGRAFLLEAGGDCHLGGTGPEGTGWRVAVEDPDGGSEPVAVLALSDTACATSSLRLRSWQAGGQPVHHLIDPRTGASAAGGLRSVTVTAGDTATAEVWSKALFVAGRHRIAELAQRHDLAALWVAEGGALGCSRSMRPALLWSRTEVTTSAGHQARR